MSQDSFGQQPPQQEEVDIIQLLNYFANGFKNGIKGIGSIFKFLFSGVIYSLKAIIVNAKLILGVLIVAVLLGFGLEKIKAPRYDSEMLIRTYFDAKFHLASNINYYNALLEEENYAAIGPIFDLSEEDAKSIIEFEIIPGPENENERIIQYDNFIRSIDSLDAHQDISYEDFIDNRDLYSGDLFLIRVESTQRDIFKRLENGISNSFANDYSLKKMQKRDSMLSIQKENIIASIREIDSLQKVYINVLEEESQSFKTKINVGDGFPLQQEKSDTKEYQLLNKEIELRDQLRQLDEQKILENVFFDVISGFQRVGNKVTSWKDRYTLIFPAIAFILLCLLYFARRTTKYVLKYE